MGASGVIGTLIMFIAVMTLTVTVVSVFKNVIDDTTSSLQIQGNAISNTLKTDLNIETVTYSNITDITTIHVRNSGKTKLDIDKIDTYIDGTFIPRNATNRTISVLSSTDLKNRGIFDPDEVVEIRVFKVLQDGDHNLIITTQYATTAEDIFVSE